MSRMPDDSDVDLRVPRQRLELPRAPWAVLGGIAAGGAIGAGARYELGVHFPTPPPAFPWTTFVINVVGCLLIGVLMVLVTDVWPGRPLMRPFLGVGVLGGFTTFSAYAVELQQLVAAGAVGVAAAYLAGTAVVALGATWLGLAATRRIVRLAGARG